MCKRFRVKTGFLFLLSLSAHADMAPMTAKMAKLHEVPLRKVAEYWKSQGSREKLTTDQAEIALLARVGSETGIAEVAYVPYTENEKEAVTQVSSAAIQAAMRSSIGERKEWEPLTSAQRKYLRKNRGSLQHAFGEKSYLWAWAQFQLKEENGARFALRGLYAAEFDRVMKLKKAETIFGRGPLSDAELYLRALLPLVQPGEARALNEQMKDLKVHLSNFPQSQILT